MKKVILLPLLLISATVAHAGPAKDKSQGDSKPLELPDTSKLNVPDTKSGRYKVEMTCTSSDGRVLKSGEAGYETCLSTSDRFKTQGGSSQNLNFGN